MWTLVTAYSCGGSQGIGDERRTLFPFHPAARNAPEPSGGTLPVWLDKRQFAAPSIRRDELALILLKAATKAH